MEACEMFFGKPVYFNIQDIPRLAMRDDPSHSAALVNPYSRSTDWYDADWES